MWHSPDPLDEFQGPSSKEGRQGKVGEERKGAGGERGGEWRGRERKGRRGKGEGKGKDLINTFSDLKPCTHTILHTEQACYHLTLRLPVSSAVICLLETEPV